MSEIIEAPVPKYELADTDAAQAIAVGASDPNIADVKSDIAALRFVAKTLLDAGAFASSAQVLKTVGQLSQIEYRRQIESGQLMPRRHAILMAERMASKISEVIDAHGLSDQVTDDIRMAIVAAIESMATDPPSEQ